jgi:hypothetical protein
MQFIVKIDEFFISNDLNFILMIKLFITYFINLNLFNYMINEDFKSFLIISIFIIVTWK